MVQTAKMMTNFFDQDIEKELKVTPATILNPKNIRAMKTLQAIFNKDVKKIFKQA